MTDVTVDEEVKIPKGVREGQRLRFTNKGHASEVYNASPGDLIGTIKIKKHDTFTRNGYDIVSDIPVTVAQAILGCKIKIDTIHGEKEITVESGLTNDIRYVIKHQGAPHIFPEEDKFGDHIIKFKIIIPSDLSDKHYELIQKLKQLEEQLGYKSGDMDSLGDLSKRKLDYKLIGDTSKRFWKSKKEYKPGNVDNNKDSSFFGRVKSMLF
jgi:molecular chaperone DnaJ